MSEQRIRVAVAGARGRMGQEVVRAVSGEQDMEVVAQIDMGDDLAEALRSSGAGILVDFTIPEVVRDNILVSLRNGVIPLVGTTGLTVEDRQTIANVCRETGVSALVAPNFALGAVLLMQFAAEAARYFPDVEVVEMHHERKVDAPSGTAVLTLQKIAEAREAAPVPAPSGEFESVPGARGGKADGGIHVHSIRLPGYVASQEVIFGSAGQRLSLRHDSIDRASFMPGVLLAIRRAPSLSGLVYGLENLL